MSTFQLNKDLYINVTPRGAYYAIQDSASDATRNVLTKLLREDETPPLTAEVAEDLTGLTGEEAFNFLDRIQSLGLISGQKQLETAPEDNMEDILPELLALSRCFWVSSRSG